MTSHEKFMKKANQLAYQATQKGNHPFGAVLVHEDKIILEAENTVNTDRDFTRHAELNLMAEATEKFSQEVLGKSTIYASSAPCVMCANTIWEAGVRKIVYGVRYETLKTTFSSKYRSIPIETVFEMLDAPLDSVGGVLEKECLETYKYWPKKEITENNVR